MTAAISPVSSTLRQFTRGRHVSTSRSRAASSSASSGPNGAGKTTTIRMIMDIIAPDAGDDPRPRRARRRAPAGPVGYLPEERGLYQKMKVVDMLAVPRPRSRASKRDARRKRIRRVARARSSSRPWRKKKVEELSKGMQQKVQFVGTLVHEPELLILDEPFTGLDPINAVLVQGLIGEFKRQGKTILFSTHVLEQAERLCDRIALLYRGKKILDGDDERDQALLPRPRAAAAARRARARARENLHQMCSGVGPPRPQRRGAEVAMDSNCSPSSSASTCSRCAARRSGLRRS